MRIARLLMVAVLAAMATVSTFAQEENTREYTEDHPLVYEDVWDLWPYSFLNDQGEPDGFNIELIRMILDELKIPYVIRLRPMQEAYEAVRDGKSDLMMGLAVGFHDEYGKFGRTAITLFTQSAVSPKGDNIQVSRFRDLGNHKVYVLEGSLCHHLMIDYGWKDNAIPVNDMRETIEKISLENEGIMVWNTLSLKWLLRRYQIDDLELTPVDMPHGEYKFMSNDLKLLADIDTVYAQLSVAEKLLPIQNKWFYPEKQDKITPQWVWCLAVLAGLVALFSAFYFINYRIQERRVSREISLRNNRLALILETCEVRLWTYDLLTKMFTWRNENGQAAFNYTTEEFSQRYHAGDFAKMKAAIDRLAHTEAPTEGEEEEIKLDVKARDAEDGDAEERDFVMALSVLQRDEKGRPTTILGTKRDVTEEHRHQQKDHEREMRYWAIFNTPTVGITYFDKQGVLRNINDKACSIYCCKKEEILAEEVTFHDMFDIDEGVGMAEADGFYVTNIIDLDKVPDEARKVHSAKRKGKLYQEVKLITVYDDSNELMGLFGITRDVTDRLTSIKQQADVVTRMKSVHKELAGYVNNINYTLNAGNVRMASYSPNTHALTIFSGINVVQHQLMQARCMTLIDESSKKKAMRCFGVMDNYTNKELDTDIKTSIRNRDHEMIHLHFHLVPKTNKQGEITEYFGVCRDVTELKATERQMQIQTAKAQEVENAKNSFLKNVSYEIRTPLNAVVGFASLFEMDHSSEDEQIFVNEILNNSDKLLNLINNILFLSRIDAGMLEIERQPSDFAPQFNYDCEMGWERNKKEGVKYIIENPYDKLVLDIDATNLGHIIQRVADNAARYTCHGTVRARYDYIGGLLRIAIDDTGEGIPQAKLAGVFERFATSSNNSSSGLGLPICKELTELMDGSFEISSEEGMGTTVWITIPCQASEVKRKKTI